MGSRTTKTATLTTVETTRPGLFGRSLLMAGALAIVVALTLSMAMRSAGAQTPSSYPPPTVTQVITIPPPPNGGGYTPGSTIPIVVFGFECDSVVTFYADGQVIGTAVAVCEPGQTEGTATFDWDTPAGLAGGVYKIDASGVGPGGTPVTVSAEVPIEAGGNLPYTGSNTTMLLGIAVVLLAAGGISVLAVRRRSAHASPTA